MNEIYRPWEENTNIGEPKNQWVEAIAAVALLVTAIAALVDNCKDSDDERREN